MSRPVTMTILLLSTLGRSMAKKPSRSPLPDPACIHRAPTFHLEAMIPTPTLISDSLLGLDGVCGRSHFGSRNFGSTTPVVLSSRKHYKNQVFLKHIFNTSGAKTALHRGPAQNSVTHWAPHVVTVLGLWADSPRKSMAGGRRE